MLVYVLNHHGKPLMPCSPARARHLLKDGKAKVVRRDPFTIKLLFGSSGYTQNVVAGMDTGSKTIGAAAIANGKVVYQAEVTLRDDVSGTMKQRATYRRTRRGRKTRYRQPRWSNRASLHADGRLAPSIRSKVESHLRERDFVERILPVRRWKVELASFDIHKITNPDVEGAGYQEGAQKDFYNVKAYVLHRDGYKLPERSQGQAQPQAPRPPQGVPSARRQRRAVEPGHALRDVSRRPARRHVQSQGEAVEDKARHRGRHRQGCHRGDGMGVLADVRLRDQVEARAVPRLAQEPRHRRSSDLLRGRRGRPAKPHGPPQDERPAKRAANSHREAVRLAEVRSRRDAAWCGIRQGQAIDRLFRNRRPRWHPD